MSADGSDQVNLTNNPALDTIRPGPQITQWVAFSTDRDGTRRFT
jgi:hypothetical protein